MTTLYLFLKPQAITAKDQEKQSQHTKADKARMKDAAHVSSMKSRVIHDLQAIFGESQVRITYGYETKYKRIQVLGLPKSHTNDAIAIASASGEVVTSVPGVYQFRCIPRGKYQLSNGKRSEHRVWAPKKVQGWKLYEVVRVKGVVGSIGGRRLKGAFVVKDLLTGKTLLEVTPRKLIRLRRPTQGWIVTCLETKAKEGRVSSPA